MAGNNHNPKREWRDIAQQVVHEPDRRRFSLLLFELLDALEAQILNDQSAGEGQLVRSSDPINRWIH